MAWEKQDAYYATQGDWNMCRVIVGGVESFELWVGYAPSIDGAANSKRRIPKTFDTAADASVWAKWAEDHSRERVEVIAVRKELTTAQRELI
jgi:hypothetical protein